MSAVPEWKCPEVCEAINPADNTTILMASTDNGTMVAAREISIVKISMLSGSLMLAGVIHFLIGVSGLVGILLRFIGPVTIVPTIVLSALLFYKIIAKWCETNWLAAVFTFAANITMSLYLANKKTPIPMWGRRRGFYILWYPLHQSFSMLLSIVFGWTLSAILTVAGAMTDDPKHYQYPARTDAKTYVIEQSPWFTLPYPGKFAGFSFSTASFVICFIATVLSVFDSIGDYSACARTCRVPPPPKFAFNRGLAAEGVMSILSGAMGCCVATVSHGPSIGLLGITRVVSRRVFQLCGLIYIVYALFGKLGAVFILIPSAVIGGTVFANVGMFIGVMLSSLQIVNLNSNRNLAIIGTSLLLGFVMPYWVQNRPNAIDTGNQGLDQFIRVLLSNPSFVGGAFSCLLDNTIPGSLRERGLLHQLNELDDKEAKELSKSYEDGPEVYKFPFIPEGFSKSKIAKYVPIFEYTGE